MTALGPSPAPKHINTPDNPERLARAALYRVIGPDDERAAMLLRRQGAVDLWQHLRHEHPDVDPHHDLTKIEQIGGRLLCPGDPEWPPAFHVLDLLADSRSQPTLRAPLALWVRGTARLPSTARAIAVVGARAATAYGSHVASDLGSALAERGWSVVSGGAFGIDAAAHRGALAAGGETIAVLAGGVDIPYPAAHADLFHDIAHHGALVSEAPPGCLPGRHRLLARNRLIAALTKATVIVEAAQRGGTLNTARHARELGKPLLVVPGPVTSALSAGCHRLLRDHPNETTLVTGIHDVLQTLDHAASPARPSS
ncbi:DNA-processing protein DprA [Parafrankia sp. EUN1f]|uniref:DNA-processing protein DprA n=1 Tax=Parafrankia sp. EUN1f TaxID=102897 RepID=UPI0001C4714E|nr:DNA-processing protein DprA [Parafrankia sp. EUN1f]EFC79705.1 DNA protecting protein DprA [Parafrankia sp. EUN1f]